MTKSSAPDETENAGNMASEKWRMTGRFQLSRLNVAMVSAALVATIVFTFVLVTHLNQNNQIPNVRVSGIPSTVSTPLANLMSLSPVPPRSAPGFRLTDQKGRNISLLSFRGKDVVLEFMDPHCVDICPLVSQEFVDAFHDLGVTSTHVVFLAVNVNQYFASVANVAAYSNEHQLDSIPSWHFFTGTTGALHAVWRDYGVAVEASNPRADIVHTSVIFFIDSRGRERYIAVPEADHTSKGVAFLPAESLISWGRGIALVVKSLSR